MADRTWEDMYDSDGVIAVDEGTYRVQVTDARPNAGSRQLWLDMKVLEGPVAGNTVEVSLYLPDPDAEKFRGQLHNFKKRTAGFDMSGALKQMDPDSEVAVQLGILADALRGQTVDAQISKRADGEYAGRNDLDATKPADDVAPVPVATPAAAPAAPVAETDEVAALKAQLAAAQAAAAVPADAMSGEVPF